MRRDLLGNNFIYDFSNSYNINHHQGYPENPRIMLILKPKPQTQVRVMFYNLTPQQKSTLKMKVSFVLATLIFFFLFWVHVFGFFFFVLNLTKWQNTQ